MKKAKYTAKQVAQWFINRSAFDAKLDNGEFLSNLKLQKLLYYAQGVHLAMKNEPLFNDEIVAWGHGPVIKSVYNNYKGEMAIQTEDDVSIDNETLLLLEEVYKVFGQYSAWKLRDMTHEEDPWRNTKQNDEIPQSLIKGYFEKHWVTNT